MNKIAVVRVRGDVNLRKDQRDTLNLLRLYRKNYCSVVEDTPSYKGMVNKVKDFVTFGEIEDSVFNELVRKRGEDYLGREADKKGKIKYRGYIILDGRKIKSYFRLNPPKKGFGRKGIKVSFKAKGALGYRADKINDLLKRMI